MNCQETQKLLHGYVDGELDLPRSLEMDQHLQECAACAQAFKALEALRAAIKGGSLYFPPPVDLPRRIQSSVRRAAKAGPTRLVSPRLWLALAASLVLVVFAGWGLMRFLSLRSADAFLVQALVDNHVRSLSLPGHLFDVESSDKHVVKPFFEGKVNFSPDPLPDDLQGFTLVGGRLDNLDNHAVAALVYRRRDHVINLFMWPSTLGSEAATKAVTRQGYHLLHWTQAGMTYWAVSNLNESELHEFVRLIQEKAR